MKKILFYEINNNIEYNIRYENDKNNTIEYYLNNKKIENVLNLRNLLKEKYDINLYEIINN